MTNKTSKQANIKLQSSSKLEDFINKIPNTDERIMLYDKTNYILMALGVIFIALGLILMAGGGHQDPVIFDTNEIYSTRRITIAPILIIIGFIIEVFAVLKKPSEVK
ncbi:MAG: DUF3098 domain-containing protein [Chitinophagales bacterium]|nr:DUF3098 domain-containing protein [Chitinophagales bacterium]MCZ2394466.1 DUF3098 domain-containing protein [Chitinophagales bacterium]